MAKTTDAQKRAKKKYVANNRDKVNAYARSYYQRNKEKLNARKRELYRLKKEEKLKALEPPPKMKID